MRVGWPDLPNRLARPLKRQTAGQDSAPPDAPCPCNHDVASLSGSEKARSPESRRAGHSGLSSSALRPVPCAWEPLWGLGAAASTWLHVCGPRPLPLVSSFQHFSSVKGSSLILPKVPCSGECFSYVGKEAIFGFGSTGLGSHCFLSACVGLGRLAAPRGRCCSQTATLGARAVSPRGGCASAPSLAAHLVVTVPTSGPSGTRRHTT